MRSFLFDLTATQPSSQSDFHGGGKYAKKILFELLNALPNVQWNFLGLYNPALPIEEEVRSRLEKHNIKLIDINECERLIKAHEVTIDRLYSALPSRKITAISEHLPIHSFYGTIHGLRFLETKLQFADIKFHSGFKSKIKTLVKVVFPFLEQRKYLNHYGFIIQKSVLITVSNHTKYSVLSYFPKVNNKINVFYSPNVTEFNSDERDFDAESFTQVNYFLLVSGDRWLKNNLRSAIALDRLFSEHPSMSHNVVITGVKNPNLYLKRIKNKDRFIFLQYVSETFLNKLYKNAFALVYMSLNEGFGYPPLEAMEENIPVIASPFTSITEVCGDAVLYANPYSINEIKNRILQLTDEKRKEDLKEKGKSRSSFIRKKQESDLKRMVEMLFT